MEESPSLRARSREIAERSEAALAAALAEESPPGDPAPRLLAGALAGTFRAMVAEIRRKLAAGEEVDAVRAEMTAAVAEMFRAIEGLGTPQAPGDCSVDHGGRGSVAGGRGRATGDGG